MSSSSKKSAEVKKKIDVKQLPIVYRAVDEITSEAYTKFTRDVTNNKKYQEAVMEAALKYSAIEPLMVKRMKQFGARGLPLPGREPDGDGKVRDWGFTPFATMHDRFSRDNVLERLNRWNIYSMVNKEANFPELELGRRQADMLHQSFLVEKKAEDAESHCWYVLKVELMGAPQVWRTVRVSAGTSLFTLADKVLIPAMGWTRQYHSFIFTETNASGAVFGLPHKYQKTGDTSTQMNSVDGLFYVAAHAGYGLVDFRDVSLYTMLRLGQARIGEKARNPAPGQQFEFVYDLGLRWTHTVTLVAIEQDDGVTNSVSVLDGAWACPPEDGNGIPDEKKAGILANAFQVVEGAGGYHMTIDSLLTGKSAGELFGEVVGDDGQGQMWLTVDNKPWPYNKDSFSVAEANQRIRDALGRRLSHAGGGGGCSEKGCPECKKFTARAGRDARFLDLCCHCGRWRENLKFCAQCLSLRYCSHRCQTEHWRQGHKRDCKQLARMLKNVDSTEMNNFNFV